MEMPPDPFVNEDLAAVMKGMYQMYAAAVQAGFPEHRAFDIMRVTLLAQFQNAIAKAQK
jgi:hypothetical protein